ncbi:MAG: hypothetical protein JSS64_06490, partial [Bacteroidetes bacterium]|nr:hypothetical protein [Bacteroidota bacterium]
MNHGEAENRLRVGDNKCSLMKSLYKIMLVPLFILFGIGELSAQLTTACNPTYSNNDASHYTTSVSVNTVPAFSHSPAYNVHDYTASQTITVNAGSTYSVSAITTGFIGVGVAVDFNNNGVLTDAGEILATPAYIATSPSTYTFNIVIPPYVVTGNYRFRVWNILANAGAGSPAGSPCGSYAYGSWVDYKLSVVNSATCLPSNSLTISNIQSNSADLNWTIPTTTPVGYFWKVVNQGDNPSVVPGVAAGYTTSLTATATGLSSSSNYQGYVRSYCGGTDTSAWSLGSSFSTPCSGLPVAGTANTSNVSPCFGASATFSLTGATTGNGLTYQWQDSLVTGSSWSAIAGATTASASITLASSGVHYVRCAVSCGSNTSNSIPVYINISSFPGGTYTINPSGSGPNNFTSFGAAVNAISCGITGPVIFNVAPGTYNEQINLPSTIGATATNYVRFNGNGATLTSAGTSTNYATLNLNGADYITIKNLTIVASDPNNGFGVHLMNNADNNTFDSCTINVSLVTTGSTSLGVCMSGSTTSYSTTGANGMNNTFSNSTISGGYYGIVFYGNALAGNSTNNIINCNVKDFYYNGIYCYYQSNATIAKNTVERPTRGGVSSFYGIYLSTGCIGMNVTQNIIRNPFGANPGTASAVYSLYVSSTASAGNENYLTNNLIANMNSSSTMGGLYLPSATYVRAYHNTISFDYTSTNTGTIYGVYSTGTTSVSIRDNIISITQPGTGTKYGLYYSGTGKISNYNNIFLNSTGGTNNYGYNSAASPTTYTTLASWKAANSNAYDSASVSVDPMFLSVLFGNYTPTNAALDNLGSPVGVLVDINGTNRSLTTPDIGAYEFSVPPCAAQPTAGNSVISTSNTCVNTKVNLTLSGNSIASGLTYQWQSGSSISGPFTNISGATSPTASVTVISSGTTYYRCLVTCTASSLQDSSTLSSVVAPTLFPGGTYTINPSGSGPSNFTSFGAAISAISCGIAGPVIFNVSSGTYNEQLTLPSTIGATATNYVRFNGNGATVSNAGSAGNFATITLKGASYITFKNLIIAATDPTNGFGMVFMNSANNNTVDSCTINASMSATGSTSMGIVFSGSQTSYSLVSSTTSNGKNNTISNTNINGGYMGISFYGSSATIDSGNTITKCSIKDFYLYGIYNYYNVNATITQNNVERPNRASVSSFYGIYFSTGCTGGNISSNRIHNPFGGTPGSANSVYALYVTSTSSSGNENYIVNNLLYNFNGTSTIYGLYFPSATYIRVFNNTVSIDYSTSNTGSIYALYSSGASSVNIRDNNLSISQPGTGTKYVLYYSGAGKMSNYNNLFLNSLGGTNYYGYNSLASPTTLATLAAWKAANANAYDTASVSVDPMFASPSTGDYTPTNSLLDNLGTPVGVAVDITGATRSLTTPDIGAYEFSVSACVGNPTAGTAGTAGNIVSACVGGQIGLNLSGFTIGQGISIQWQRSPAGSGSWQTMANATSNSAIDTLQAATDYRAIVTCANGGGQDISNTVTVSLNPFYMCYCSPLTGNSLQTSPVNYITGVSIPPFTLSSGNNMGAGGYTQFNVASTVSLMQGQTYTLNATQSTTYGVEMWVDWDQSGTFDSSEYTLLSSANPASATFTVPSNAMVGTTGLRLRSYVTTAFGAKGACSNISSGRETEDYILNIAAGNSCSGTPTAGTVYGVPDSTCPTIAFTLSDTSSTKGTGLQYQWQKSPHGANTWTNISGATTIYYTVASGITVPTDFRFVVSCIASGLGDTSNVKAVSYVYPASQCYCIPPAPTYNCTKTYISQVSINSLNNVSNGCLGANSFSDYRNLPATPLLLGSTYNATVSAALCNLCLSTLMYDETAAIWIDFDQSGTFDANEFFGILNATVSGTNRVLTGTVTIPSNATLGNTVMRVRSNYNSLLTNTQACVQTAYGETEDYTVNITNNPLAISLKTISATNVGTRNRVDWATGVEKAGDAFEVERSVDGRNFTYLANIKG